MGKRNLILNHSPEELFEWQLFLAPESSSFSYNFRQLCKKSEKEISTCNAYNKILCKELERCTLDEIDLFFSDYLTIQHNLERVKRLLNYMGNPEITVFPADKSLVGLLNSFLRRTSQESLHKSSNSHFLKDWFSQVAKHFDKMSEEQIALACELSGVLERV